jgi:hypothetical protein
MNQDQLKSFVRTLLKVASGCVLTWTASKSESAKTLGQFLAGFLTGPDALAGGVLLITTLWSHFTHAGQAKQPGQAQGVLLAFALLGSLAVIGFGTGCAENANQATFRTLGASTLALQESVKGYDVMAAAGKTTPQENLAVKQAYEKAQAALAIAYDAGQAMAAAGTNAPDASAVVKYQAAMANLDTATADLENLVQKVKGTKNGTSSIGN